MKKYLIIVVVIVVGAALRLFWLGDVPKGVFRDEAALGYNAYAIWQTGKDEFGVAYPLIFRSFEVFFLPLYVYSSALVVGFFGLSEFSSRLISSVSGVVALFLIYLITKKILGRKAAVFSTLLLARLTSCALGTLKSKSATA